jgi:hypothetical protein
MLHSTSGPGDIYDPSFLGMKIYSAIHHLWVQDVFIIFGSIAEYFMHTTFYEGINKLWASFNLGPTKYAWL